MTFIFLFFHPRANEREQRCAFGERGTVDLHGAKAPPPLPRGSLAAMGGVAKAMMVAGGRDRGGGGGKLVMATISATVRLLYRIEYMVRPSCEI